MQVRGHFAILLLIGFDRCMTILSVSARAVRWDTRGERAPGPLVSQVHVRYSPSSSLHLAVFDLDREEGGPSATGQIGAGEITDALWPHHNGGFKRRPSLNPASVDCQVHFCQQQSENRDGDKPRPASTALRAKPCLKVTPPAVVGPTRPGAAAETPNLRSASFAKRSRRRRQNAVLAPLTPAALGE